MTFEIAIDRVLGLEGAYTDGAGDPGGETHWGISKRAYPDLDIASLSRDGAVAIYRRDFWEHVDADRLPDGVQFQALDFAVNSGISTAIRYLQRAVGVADDGWWGAHSRAAATALSESDLVLRYLAERIDFLTRRANWPTAGKGWMRRLAADLRYGAEDTN